MTAAKKHKKYRTKCKLENDLLVIKGKKYDLAKRDSVKDLSNLPHQLKPSRISSHANKDIYGYFGKLNPLSNFHHSPARSFRVYFQIRADKGDEHSTPSPERFKEPRKSTDQSQPAMTRGL